MAVIADAINRHTLAVVAPIDLPLAKSKSVCVLTAAVGLQVFSQLGFSEVQPMTLEVYASTREDYEALERNEPMALGPLRMGPPKSRVGTGHVGLIVEGAIVDPTAGQITQASLLKAKQNQGMREAVPDGRPFGVLVPDTVVISKDLRPVDNTAECANVAVNGGETVLQYRTVPDYHGYKDSELWQEKAIIDEVVKRVIKELSAPKKRPDPTTAFWQAGWKMSDLRSPPRTPKR